MTPRGDVEVCSLTVRLDSGADTATLLRVVSILHSRGSLVRRLRFDVDGRGGPTVAAEVSLPGARLASVGAALTRAVEVLEVRTERRSGPAREDVA